MNHQNSSDLQISASIMSTNSLEDTSNPPGSVRSFSNFGDSACGEPLVAQHVIIDFTPKESDTEFLQKKVCSFWDFVGIRPELKNILVLPDPDIFRRSSSSDMTSEVARSDSTKSFDTNTLRECTAVSMLEFVEEKGLIDRTFESKLPQSMCSLGSREYHQNESPTAFEKTVLNKKEKSGNFYQRHLKYSKRTQTVDFHPKARADARNLCETMQQWDDQHPKSMKSPGHAYSSSQDIPNNSLY